MSISRAQFSLKDVPEVLGPREEIWGSLALWIDTPREGSACACLLDSLLIGWDIVRGDPEQGTGVSCPNLRSVVVQTNLKNLTTWYPVYFLTSSPPLVQPPGTLLPSDWSLLQMLFPCYTHGLSWPLGLCLNVPFSGPLSLTPLFKTPCSLLHSIPFSCFISLYCINQWYHVISHIHLFIHSFIFLFIICFPSLECNLQKGRDFCLFFFFISKVLEGWVQH